MDPIADYQLYAYSLHDWIKKWNPVGIAPPHDAIRQRIDLAYRQKIYPLVEYLRANGSTSIIVPRMLHSALETVKAADKSMIPIPFEDIKTDDSNINGDLPPTPDIVPQPLTDDPLEDLDIGAIRGPLDMVLQTITLPHDGPNPITVSRVIMTTAKTTAKKASKGHGKAADVIGDSSILG